MQSRSFAISIRHPSANRMIRLNSSECNAAQLNWKVLKQILLSPLQAHAAIKCQSSLLSTRSSRPFISPINPRLVNKCSIQLFTSHAAPVSRIDSRIIVKPNSKFPIKWGCIIFLKIKNACGLRQSIFVWKFYTFTDWFAE